MEKNDEFAAGYRAGLITGTYGNAVAILHEIDAGTPLDKIRDYLVYLLEEIEPNVPQDIKDGLQGVLDGWDEADK